MGGRCGMLGLGNPFRIVARAPDCCSRRHTVPINKYRMAALRAGDRCALTGDKWRFKLGLDMGRTITLLSAFWAFSIPMLCTSGVLVHPCDCESPTGCGHETKCADDPCNVTVIVQNGSSIRAFDL